MSGGWERLAFIELTGNATEMDTANDSSFVGNDFPARDNLFIEIQTVPNSTSSIDLTFNVGGSTTAGVYNYKYQNNAVAQASSTNQTEVDLQFSTTNDQTSTNCGTVFNIDGQEKLGVFEGVYYDGLIATGTIPDVRQLWVKWATTSGQIQRVIITGDNSETGFADGSSLTVWGSADKEPPSLPNGSVFITNDTNVHYMWDGTDTWNEVA